VKACPEFPDTVQYILTVHAVLYSSSLVISLCIDHTLMHRPLFAYKIPVPVSTQCLASYANQVGILGLTQPLGKY